jgi:hypothetical protein
VNELRQRSDYTHKANLQQGRHGWLRLTPAYSVKVVEEIIATYEQQPLRILDPFCGTATTALSASYHGHHAVTMDINPFLVWFGRVKTAHYTSDCLEKTRQAGEQALTRISDTKAGVLPPIHNIERWWSSDVLEFLSVVRRTIDEVVTPCSPENDLLRVAFCRTLMGLSNASFGHQSMSFKEEPHSLVNIEEMQARYRSDLDHVLIGAALNPGGKADIMQIDARNMSGIPGKFDLVITSPPYANRMSYIRELRPYMYWLGFLMDGREAGEMDWQAIGGTWGIATSRLSTWQGSKTAFSSPDLDKVLSAMVSVDNKNGKVLANYVARYFEDIWSHLRCLPSKLNKNAEVHYIVGNSSFYGTLLEVEELYAQMLRYIGFQDVKCRPIRKRNSKKELVEFDVTARWMES